MLKGKKSNFGYVTLLDTSRMNSISKVRVGRNPTGISTIPFRNKWFKIYVTNQDSNSISVIRSNLRSAFLIKNIKTTGKPNAFGVFTAVFSSQNSQLKNVARIEPKSSVIQEDSNDEIMNFVAETLIQYGGSQFAALAGLNPPSASQQSVDQVLTELGQLQTQLNSIGSQLSNLVQGFEALSLNLAQNNANQAAVTISNIFTDTTAKWNAFSNVLSAGANSFISWQDLTSSSNTQAQDILQKTITTGYLADIEEQASNLSQAAGTLSNPVTNYVSAAQELLSTNVTSQIDKGLNINSYSNWNPPGGGTLSLSVFDTFNNTLAGTYISIGNVLQQLYTIESTFLYLQANLPTKFGNVVISEPGMQVATLANYSAMQATLNNIYQSRMDYLASVFDPAIVSDAGGSAPYLPARTNSYAPNNLLINGTWNQVPSNIQDSSQDYSSNLFIWQGLKSALVSPYAGVWDGTLLTVQASNQALNMTASLNLGQACSQSNPGVSFWYQQGWQAQLQCSPVGVSSDGQYSGSVQPYFAHLDPQAVYYFTFMGSSINSTGFNLISQSSSLATGYSSSQIQVSSSTPPVYSIATASTITSSGQAYFSGNIALTGANGFTGQFLLGGQGTHSGFYENWNMNLSCPSTGNCYYIQNPPNYDYDGAICLGGNLIEITGNNDQNTALIAFNGSCPAPQ